MASSKKYENEELEILPEKAKQVPTGVFQTNLSYKMIYIYLNISASHVLRMDQDLGHNDCTKRKYQRIAFVVLLISFLIGSLVVVCIIPPKGMKPPRKNFILNFFIYITTPAYP